MWADEIPDVLSDEEWRELLGRQEKIVWKMRVSHSIRAVT
jgi:hypothetical protein